MRYCSECGSLLGAPPPTRCDTCGREHWRNAKPGAAGLVVRNDKLLLVRRAHEPWLGSWCAPSGFCDGDEHPILTAEREIAEEAGIRARVVGFLGVWVGPYGDRDADEWVSVAYYHADPLDDQMGSPDGVESMEVGWFAIDDLPPSELLAPPDRFPAVLEAWRVARAAREVSTALLDRPESIEILAEE